MDASAVSSTAGTTDGTVTGSHSVSSRRSNRQQLLSSATGFNVTAQRSAAAPYRSRKRRPSPPESPVPTDPYSAATMQEEQFEFDSSSVSSMSNRPHRRTPQAHVPEPLGNPPAVPPRAAPIPRVSQYQALILFLLKTLQRRGYRRYRGKCYEEIVIQRQANGQQHHRDLSRSREQQQSTSDGPEGVVSAETSETTRANKTCTCPPSLIGTPSADSCTPPVDAEQRTHAWQPAGEAGDLQAFVLTAVTKETELRHWLTLVGGRTLRSVVTFLGQCQEAEFLELQPDRGYFAFRNGLYCTAGRGEFLAWEHASIPPDVVACHYHDLDFPLALAAVQPGDADSIATPALDTILNPQLAHLPAAERRRVKMWIYALLGRTLYAVNARDRWQVMLVILGRCATGKSLLLRAISRWWRREDVGILSSQGRHGEGDLEPLLAAKLVVCYELTQGMTLNQAQFQSMVSGEELSVSQLYKTSITLPWTAPCVFAGNELASWTDTSGSLLRRMILLAFDTPIENCNPQLDALLAAELPAHLAKCCMIYNSVTRAYGEASLWSPSCKNSASRAMAGDSSAGEGAATANGGDGDAPRMQLPAYFHDTRGRLAEMMHPIVSFLRNSPDLLFAGRDRSHGVGPAAEGPPGQSLRGGLDRGTKTNTPGTGTGVRSDCRRKRARAADDETSEHENECEHADSGSPSQDSGAEALGMPYERFKKLANDYCASNGLRSIVWGSPHTYTSALHDYGISRGRLTTAHLHWGARVYDGKIYGLNTEWMHGIAEKSILTEARGKGRL